MANAGVKAWSREGRVMMSIETPRPDRLLAAAALSLLERAVAHEATMARVRAEYMEMPGLSLTLHQAERFLGIPEDTCLRVLSALRTDGFLRLRADGRYIRS